MDKALDAPAVIVNDKRRFRDVGDELLPAPVVYPKSVGVLDPFMYVGQFYEINGICYRVRKVTPHDIVLRRFTGTLEVPKVNATAQQIRGARPA